MPVFLKHFGAQDIRGHQVGRELNALVVKAQHHAERMDQLGLCQARNADQQNVTTRKQGDEAFLHHRVLTVDDMIDRGARLLDEVRDALHIRDGVFRPEIFRLCYRCRHTRAPPSKAK